jgi:hypothetical protein
MVVRGVTSPHGLSFMQEAAIMKADTEIHNELFEG